MILTSWDDNVHKLPGQKEKFLRALLSTECRFFDLEAGTGIMLENDKPYNVNTRSCICEDFAADGLPCRHIYRLLLDMRFDCSRWKEELGLK